MCSYQGIHYKALETKKEKNGEKVQYLSMTIEEDDIPVAPFAMAMAIWMWHNDWSKYFNKISRILLAAESSQSNLGVDLIWGVSANSAIEELLPHRYT